MRMWLSSRGAPQIVGVFQFACCVLCAERHALALGNFALAASFATLQCSLGSELVFIWEQPERDQK